MLIVFVCVYDQDLFKKAILEPGSPEDFALKLVQDAIKPQVSLSLSPF